jgi:hypothetical protein
MQAVTVPEGRPPLHRIVEDTATQKIGRIMAFVGGYVQLRPIGGGLEWDANLKDLRTLTAKEALSAGVAIANARSRGEQP